MRQADNDIETKARTHYPAEGSHGWNHIQDVLANARRMRRRELLKKELAAIMYHDSSLMTGDRETHAEDSAEIARKELAGLFRKRQLADIVNAIAHHRASYEGTRNSRLEDLVAAADRPVPDFAKQVARSWKYHEELGEPEDIRSKNVAEHLKEKYGHGGYAYGNAPKLYLKTYGRELRDIMSKFDGLTPESVAAIMSGAEKKAEMSRDRIQAQYARHPQESLARLVDRLARKKWGPEDVKREYESHSREYDETKEDKEFLDRYIIARIGEKYDRKSKIKQALMRKLWEKGHNGESFDAALPARMARFRQYEGVPFPVSEKKAGAKIDIPALYEDVRSAYADMGYPVSGDRLALSEQPTYTNGKPVPADVLKPNSSGGNTQDDGTVRINPRYRAVMRHWKIRGSGRDFLRKIIGHELGHHIDKFVLSQPERAEERKRLLKEIAKAKFHTGYTDSYGPDTDPRKLDKELLAEYLADMVRRRLEKKAQVFSEDGKTVTLSKGQTPSHVVTAYNKTHPDSKITVPQFLEANGNLAATKFRAGKAYSMPVSSPAAAASAKPVAKTEPAPALAAPAPAEGPLGFRQNNPGNLRSDGKTLWQGATGVPAAGEFLTFSSPYQGVRAMARTLFNYGRKHKIDSLEGAVKRYAPAKENNQKAYLASVRQRTGLKPGARIDLTDEATLQKLVPAMGSHEIGPQYFSTYDPSLVSNAVVRAMR